MARIWEDCAAVAYRILNTRVHVFLSLFKLIVSTSRQNRKIYKPLRLSEP